MRRGQRTRSPSPRPPPSSSPRRDSRADSPPRRRRRGHSSSRSPSRSPPRRGPSPRRKRDYSPNPSPPPKRRRRSPSVTRERDLNQRNNGRRHTASPTPPRSPPRHDRAKIGGRPPGGKERDDRRSPAEREKSLLDRISDRDDKAERPEPGGKDSKRSNSSDAEGGQARGGSPRNGIPHVRTSISFLPQQALICPY